MWAESQSLQPGAWSLGAPSQALEPSAPYNIWAGSCLTWTHHRSPHQSPRLQLHNLLDVVQVVCMEAAHEALQEGHSHPRPYRGPSNPPTCHLGQVGLCFAGNVVIVEVHHYQAARLACKGERVGWGQGSQASRASPGQRSSPTSPPAAARGRARSPWWHRLYEGGWKMTGPWTAAEAASMVATDTWAKPNDDAQAVHLLHDALRGADQGPVQPRGSQTTPRDQAGCTVPTCSQDLLGLIIAQGSSLPRPPLTCPKDDRPWLWALSSPVSTSQLSALGEQRAGAQGEAWLSRPTTPRASSEDSVAV